MPPVSLNLVVIRAADPQRVVQFYSALGLIFQQEQHGAGPVHWSAQAGEVTFEVYPAAIGAVAAELRMGFAVPDVAASIQAVERLGAQLVTPPKSGPWGLRAVVTDPEGHRVELVQSPRST